MHVDRLDVLGGFSGPLGVPRGALGASWTYVVVGDGTWNPETSRNSSWVGGPCRGASILLMFSGQARCPGAINHGQNKRKHTMVSWRITVDVWSSEVSQAIEVCFRSRCLSFLKASVGGFLPSFASRRPEWPGLCSLELSLEVPTELK